MSQTRREFIQRFATASGALMAPIFVPSTAFGANELPSLGVIGAGSQGVRDIIQFLRLTDSERSNGLLGQPAKDKIRGIPGSRTIRKPRVRLAAVCDIDGYRLARALPPEPLTDRQIGGSSSAGGKKKSPPRTQRKDLLAQELRDSLNDSQEAELLAARRFDDYREMLQSDIDAVVVATPDHWHALMAIDSCNAGKHVYCEPPLSHNIAEGRAIVDAASRSSRVFLMGTQLRSARQFRIACQLVRAKKIGELRRIMIGLPEPDFHVVQGDESSSFASPKIMNDLERVGAERIAFDIDTWVGPAPWPPTHYPEMPSRKKQLLLRGSTGGDRTRAYAWPYMPERVHHNFRYFWDYGGGALTSWGAHYLDIAHWAMEQGNRVPSPIEIEGRILDQDPLSRYEVPKRSYVKYLYENRVTISLMQGQDYSSDSITEADYHPLGITFVGTEGAVFVRMPLRDKSGNEEQFPKEISSTFELERYLKRCENFIRSTPRELVNDRLVADLSGKDKVESEYGEDPGVRDYAKHFIDCIQDSKNKPIASAQLGHRAATACHLANAAMLLRRRIEWDPIKEKLVGPLPGDASAELYAKQRFSRSNRSPYDASYY